MTSSLVNKWRFERRGGHGCSNSDYRLQRTTCCGAFGVEDAELQDLYTDPRDLTRSVLLTYDPRSEPPPACPFCNAATWETVEVTDAAAVPADWRWATERGRSPGDPSPA